MARKNSYGKYILSAGEIGIYTVCPESWRLKIVKRLEVKHSESVTIGADLHKQWANDQETALFFAGGIKLIIFLIVVAVLVTGIALHH